MSDEQHGRVGGNLVRRVSWQRLDRPSMEICHLLSSPNHPRYHNKMMAKVLAAWDGVSWDCLYNVCCDTSWRTTYMHFLYYRFPTEPKYRFISLTLDNGNWTLEESGPDPNRDTIKRELPELAGCIDVELGISPSTNTLPIRRLNLAIGESRKLTAAWVRFPELTVEPLAQRYTRLAERRYRYESTASGFTAELEVDDLGLVVTYENLWQRVAESDGE